MFRLLGWNFLEYQLLTMKVLILRYSCELSFRGMEEQADIQSFHDHLLEVEQKLIEVGVDNGILGLRCLRIR